MPYFMVSGTSKSSGRKIKPRQFRAQSEKAARDQARKSGMIPETVELIPVCHFLFDVAGASHSNTDGSDRQDIVRRCKKLQPIDLCREINNPHDVHAIRVHRKNGDQIGFIPKELAVDIVEGYFADGACVYSAIGTGVVALGDSPTLQTVRVLIVVALPQTTKETRNAYAHKAAKLCDIETPCTELLAFRPIPVSKWQSRKGKSTDSSGNAAVPRFDQSRKRISTRKKAATGCFRSLAMFGMILILVAVAVAVVSLIRN